jgi:hypothetical protein
MAQLWLSNSHWSNGVAQSKSEPAFLGRICTLTLAPARPVYDLPLRITLRHLFSIFSAPVLKKLLLLANLRGCLLAGVPRKKKNTIDISGLSPLTVFFSNNPHIVLRSPPHSVSLLVTLYFSIPVSIPSHLRASTTAQMTKDWDSVRERIRDLSVTQKKSLEEVKAMMESEHRFRAS